MNEMCGDNRFEIIARAKKHLLDATNIDTSPKEMEVLDDFLFRCWQMGWLDRYDTADTPQTDWKKEKSEKSLCNSCIKDCDNRKRNLYTVECNRYEPQTDCGWK